MKKKLLSIAFITISICLSIAIGGGFTYAPATESTNIEIEMFSYKYYENVSKTIELYEKAMTLYLT